MALNDTALQLLEILQDEGFSNLAGQILIEISEGREVECFDEGNELTHYTKREPLAADAQLAETIKIIRLQLIEPIKKFLEAENIASSLAEDTPTRIRMIDPAEGTEAAAISTDVKASVEIAKNLDELLAEILSGDAIRAGTT